MLSIVPLCHSINDKLINYEKHQYISTSVHQDNSTSVQPLSQLGKMVLFCYSHFLLIILSCVTVRITRS